MGPPTGGVGVVGSLGVEGGSGPGGRLSTDFHDPDSWSSSLPACGSSGVGWAENLDYRVNGQHVRRHEREDAAFATSDPDQGLSLYCVLDGAGGRAALDFAKDKLPAEILFADSDDTADHHKVTALLHRAFANVEKDFLQRKIDPYLAERAAMVPDLQGMGEGQASLRFPEQMARLGEINGLVSSGVTAVVAVVVRDHLYVANVGDCRALLVKTDAEGCLRVVQLSVQHDRSNQDEFLRLRQLGLPDPAIRHIQGPTRCLGDYPRKGGWKDHDQYAAATEEPVIATPDVHPPIPIDGSAQFLLLCSPGLYTALEDVFGVSKVNAKLAQTVAAMFETGGTVAGVAQAVVDLVCRHHLDSFTAHNERSFLCSSRDDITLLIRNFHYPLASARQPWDPATLSSTQSSAVSTLPLASANALPLDKEGRIAPYVSFDAFYKAVQDYGKPSTPH